MMLRLFVLTLLMLNGLYFAWSQAWFTAYGWGPMVQQEPQRLTQQIAAQAIHLLSPQEAAKLQAANTKPAASCLQSDWLDAALTNTLRRTLEATLPEGGWSLNPGSSPERWIIYMGKYANPQELAKKRAQLASLNLNFAPLNNASLAPGLSLGVFETQQQASIALEALTLRGVRTARVLLEQAAAPGWRLQLPLVDEVLLKKLVPIKTALNGKTLGTC